MPILKRILSSLALEKPRKDEVIEEGAHSPLKRSNAVLRKKHKSKLGDGDLSSNLSLLDENDEEYERMFRELQLAAYPDLNHPSNGRSVQDLDNEMEAIADLRDQARFSVAPKHQQYNEDEDDWAAQIRDARSRGRRDAIHSDSPKDLRAEAVHMGRSTGRRGAVHFDLPENATIEDLIRSSYRHSDSLYALYSSASEEKIRKSHRYLDPLEAIREGRLQRGRYSSPDEIFSIGKAKSQIAPSVDEEYHEYIEQIARRRSAASLGRGPQAPFQIHADAGRSRREAWLYGASTSSHPLDASEKNGSLQTFYYSANSSPVERASRSDEEQDVVLKGRAKREQGYGSGEQVDNWLSVQEHLQSERSINAEEYVDAMEGARPRSSKDLRISDEHVSSSAAGDQPDLSNVPLESEISRHRDCVVCGDSKTTLDFPAKPPTTACEHKPQTCTECLESWMTSEVDTKGSESIKCPECPQTLSYTDIQRAASPTTFATYDKLTIRAALGALPDFSFCLSPTCTSGQENPHSANFMDCHACGYKQCLSHRTPWHADETCAEYDYRTSGQKKRDEEKKTEDMLDTVSKKCPNPKGCGWRIQKVDGCDHMTCRRCRWEFCWECRASQKEIRKKGNEAHHGECKYHSKNLEVAWPFNVH